MNLEELKEDLNETCRADYYQDLHDLSPGQLALFELKDEILALVESLGRENYWDQPSSWGRLNVIRKLSAFYAKLETL